MAVGGAGIVGGMNPKGYVDMEAALAQIEATKGLRADPPGTVAIHYGETGFFREVYSGEDGVIAGIRSIWTCCPPTIWSSSAWTLPSLPLLPT